jgi:hypothetical protein
VLSKRVHQQQPLSLMGKEQRELACSPEPGRGPSTPAANYGQPPLRMTRQWRSSFEFGRPPYDLSSLRMTDDYFDARVRSASCCTETVVAVLGSLEAAVVVRGGKAQTAGGLVIS